MNEKGQSVSSSAVWAPVGQDNLRDHFAGLAMLAHLITDTVPGPACDALVEAAEKAGRDPVLHLAMNAYEVADAMIEARVQDALRRRGA